MIYAAANSSLQKRAEEAIRYAIDYQLGYQGNVYATDEATNTITVALISNNTLAAGDPVIIGDQSRTIVSISVIANTNSQRYIIILSAAVDVTAGDIVRADLSNNVRRSDDMRSREAVPWLCFVQIVNLKQDDPGSDYFSGVLVVSLHSLYNTITAEDGTAVSDASLLADIEPHDAKCSAIVNILNDPSSLWQLVQPGAENRPVSDLGIVAILNNEEPGSASLEGAHNFETRRVIRLIRTD